MHWPVNSMLQRKGHASEPQKQAKNELQHPLSSNPLFPAWMMVTAHQLALLIPLVKQWQLISAAAHSAAYTQQQSSSNIRYTCSRQ